MSKKIKRIFIPVFALALALCACGGQTPAGFRILETVGTRRYNVICRLDDRIAPQIDAAMERLAASGELSAISIRWLGRDAITLKGKAAEPEEQEEEGDRDEAGDEPAARRLIVGVEAEFNPFAFTENGELRGMSIDIAGALARALGWEAAYQPIKPAEVGTQLSSGNIDCALGFDPDTVSAEKYTVGVGYMDSDVVVAARASGGAKRLRDTKGERIGVIDDPVVQKILKENEKVTRYASGATVYLSVRRCLNALDNGWCAAIAMDRIMLEHLS